MTEYPPLKKKYIAFDPGRTTGVCVATATFQDNLVTDIDVVESSAVRWNRRFEATEFYVNWLPYDYCIVEDFRLYKAKAKAQVNNRFPSSQLIGIIEYLCWKRKLPVQFQMASERKRAKVEPEFYEVLGGITRNGNPVVQHRWDAFQHLRYFVVKRAAGIWQAYLNEITV